MRISDWSSDVCSSDLSIRPRLGRLALDPTQPVYLIGAPDVVALAPKDLRDMGLAEVYVVAGGQAALEAAGPAVVASPDSPTPEEAVAIPFFAHERTDRHPDPSRPYLAWDQPLLTNLALPERDA